MQLASLMASKILYYLLQQWSNQSFTREMHTSLWFHPYWHLFSSLFIFINTFSSYPVVEVGKIRWWNANALGDGVPMLKQWGIFFGTQKVVAPHHIPPHFEHRSYLI